MSNKSVSYDSEAALCAHLIEQAGREDGLVAYPETCGWDILLHDAVSGVQCGVEAKLRPSVKALAQALSPSRHIDGPDVHAVLVPSAPSHDYRLVASACGVFIITPAMMQPTRFGRRSVDGRLIPGSAPLRQGINGAAGGALAWEHPRRHRLPSAVPTVEAGVPSPRVWTPWKDAAMKICARLELRGWVTTLDFEAVEIGHATWVRTGWIQPTARRHGRRTVYEPGPTPLPSAEHPAEYEQVLRAQRAARATGAWR